MADGELFIPLHGRAPNVPPDWKSSADYRPCQGAVAELAVHGRELASHNRPVVGPQRLHHGILAGSLPREHHHLVGVVKEWRSPVLFHISR